MALEPLIVLGDFVIPSFEGQIFSIESVFLFSFSVSLGCSAGSLVGCTLPSLGDSFLFLGGIPDDLILYPLSAEALELQGDWMTCKLVLEILSSCVKSLGALITGIQLTRFGKGYPMVQARGCIVFPHRAKCEESFTVEALCLGAAIYIHNLFGLVLAKL
jgi:hypothetical protein